MKKVITIIGARPQFIKAAVLSGLFSDLSDFEDVIIHTGQHYDAGMSDIFFNQLGIPEPRYNLGIGGGTHGQNTGRMLEEIESVLLKEKPDIVLVYGDTDSTLAGALAAAKIHIPVAHVEAGLRSYNKAMPEEINRILTDKVSDILFVPTKNAYNNLIGEGTKADMIEVVGDVMFDATTRFSGKDTSHYEQVMMNSGCAEKKYVLATFHRAENTNDRNRLSEILAGLGKSKLKVILPIHPRTRKSIEEFSLSIPSNIHLIDPVGYFEMLTLEKRAAVIATDSGGVQKEAFFHGVPCVTMRDETEWVELVDAGCNILTGADAAKISDAINLSVEKTVIPSNLYGDGKAGEKIVQKLQKFVQ